MTYLLDANVFIEAKRRHYGFDFCPAFWDWLIEQNVSRRVFSVEKIGAELRVGGDDLADWAAARGERFFLPTDEGTLRGLTRAVRWASTQNYRPGALNLFADDADAYLVGHAAEHDFVVVTHEIPSDGLKQVKIPNACVGLNVRYLNTFEMLRAESARFVLGATS
jgi:hypothetical protein